MEEGGQWRSQERLLEDRELVLYIFSPGERGGRRDGALTARARVSSGEVVIRRFFGDGSSSSFGILAACI